MITKNKIVLNKVFPYKFSELEHVSHHNGYWETILATYNNGGYERRVYVEGGSYYMRPDGETVWINDSDVGSLPR